MRKLTGKSLSVLIFVDFKQRHDDYTQISADRQPYQQAYPEHTFLLFC